MRPKPGTWKWRSLKIVDRILSENPGVIEPKAQRKLLSENYPYMERMGAAYKAWCWAVNQRVQEQENKEAIRYMWMKG